MVLGHLAKVLREVLLSPRLDTGGDVISNVEGAGMVGLPLPPQNYSIGMEVGWVDYHLRIVIYTLHQLELWTILVPIRSC